MSTNPTALSAPAAIEPALVAPDGLAAHLFRPLEAAAAPAPAKGPDDMRGSWAEGVETETGDILSRAGRGLLAAAGLFVVWAVLFPIGSAVVAEGVVVSNGRNKILQHRSGGVVVAIGARDGETVAEGDAVLRLDPLNDQAELTRLKARFAVLEAMRTRLQAENALAATGDDDAPNPMGLRSGSYDLTALVDVRYTGATVAGDTLVLEQQREFERGRGAVGAEIASMQARSDALVRRRQGIGERLDVVAAQLASLERQLVAYRPAVAKGFIAQKVIWDIEDQLLARRSERANLDAENDALGDDAREIASRVRQARLADQRETSVKLTEVLAEIRQIEGQLQAAEATVRSSEVRAPVAGTVVHSKHTTLGAVAAPGEVLAEIVPQGGALAVKARVQPNDIAHVRAGQSARVKISALNARLFDDVDATVTRVAADSTTDEKTAQHYFEVDLLLKPAAPAEQALLGAGMTAQVYIEGQSRTFAGYVMTPFVDSLSRAFREP